MLDVLGYKFGENGLAIDAIPYCTIKRIGYTHFLLFFISIGNIGQLDVQLFVSCFRNGFRQRLKQLQPTVIFYSLATPKLRQMGIYFI